MKNRDCIGFADNTVFEQFDDTNNLELVETATTGETDVTTTLMERLPDLQLVGASVDSAEVPSAVPVEFPESDESGVVTDRLGKPGGVVPLFDVGHSPLKRFFALLGPGLITGASDDDPSGIGTYSMAGAALGFTTLWTALITFPLMSVVQFTCAKIGMVTGMGLGEILREHYPKKLLYVAVFTLLIANTINAGADLGAMASAINLLVPQIPAAAAIIPITLSLLLLQILGSYNLITRVFKWLTIALFAYVGTALFVHMDAREVLHGTFVPSVRWDWTFVSTLVAILGTTISPYLFFWQADQEVEEEIRIGNKHLWQRKGTNRHALKHRAIDVLVGMFFSNFVMYFIILTTAATLFKAGHHNIATAQDAAAALRPLAGNYAALLFAVGLVGTGFLAVPVLTCSASYAVAQAFGWKHGLRRRLIRARGFYAIIVASTVIGMVLNFVGIKPLDALFWTAVLNGILAPPLLFVIMSIANNKNIMGRHRNGWFTNALGYGTAVLMSIAAIAMFIPALHH